MRKKRYTKKLQIQIHRNYKYIEIANIGIIGLRLKINICLYILKEIKAKLQQLGRVPETIKRDLRILKKNFHRIECSE